MSLSFHKVVLKYRVITVTRPDRQTDTNSYIFSTNGVEMGMLRAASSSMLLHHLYIFVSHFEDTPSYLVCVNGILQ